VSDRKVGKIILSRIFCLGLASSSAIKMG